MRKYLLRPFIRLGIIVAIVPWTLGLMVYLILFADSKKAEQIGWSMALGRLWDWG